jgi:hypothetical protein
VKRVARAERFGISGTQEVNRDLRRICNLTVQDFIVDADTVRDLRVALGVDMSNEVKRAKYRLNALHVYGVNDMSTYDVMKLVEPFLLEVH